MTEEIKVLKANNPQLMDDFIRVTKNIYHGCKQYVPDFESDIKGLFDIKTNPGLEFSDIQPFVAYLNDKPVGRIVGIVNRKANKKWNIKNVRFSMIEFVDDKRVSKALLQAVEEWGKERGMEKIHGPLGVTDFDKEGMLVEDFDMTGSMTAIYNLPYYPIHMEALGYEKEVDWLQVRINIPQEVPPRYARVAQYAKETIKLRVEKFSTKMLLGENGQEVFTLLNQAYEKIFGFSELSRKQVESFLNKYVKLINSDLIPVIKNENDELVGVAVTMSSLAEALQKSEGKLWPFGWYYILRSLKWRIEQNAEMLLIAVRPDYQGLGVNAMFFDDLIPIYNRLGIKWAETGPQLENNVRELTQWKPLKPEFVKRRRCFIKPISNLNN